MPDFEHECENETPGVAPERVLAAVIHFMSCYVRDGGSPRLARVVNRHLELLARCPEAGAMVRETCRRMGAVWTAIEAAGPQREAQPAAALETLRAVVH